MATLNDIDLTTNTRIANEVEGSAIERETKHTEDGKKFVFQKHKQKNKTLVYDCSQAWLTWAVIKQLIALRDSGQPAVLTHNDGRVFNVLIDSIEGAPLKAFNVIRDHHKFQITLNLIEI